MKDFKGTHKFSTGFPQFWESCGVCYLRNLKVDEVINSIRQAVVEEHELQVYEVQHFPLL